MEIILTGNNLTLEDFIAVARGRAKVSLAATAANKAEEARRKIERIIAAGKTVYGINTGFGKLSNVAVGNDELETLQANLFKIARLRDWRAPARRGGAGRDVASGQRPR